MRHETAHPPISPPPASLSEGTLTAASRAGTDYEPWQAGIVPVTTGGPFGIKIAGKPKPVQRSRSFATRREAAEFARVAERLYESRGVVAPEEKTVADQIELFLSWCSVHKRAATGRQQRSRRAPC